MTRGGYIGRVRRGGWVIFRHSIREQPTGLQGERVYGTGTERMSVQDWLIEQEYMYDLGHSTRSVRQRFQAKEGGSLAMSSERNSVIRRATQRKSSLASRIVVLVRLEGICCAARVEGEKHSIGRRPKERRLLRATFHHTSHLLHQAGLPTQTCGTGRTCGAVEVPTNVLTRRAATFRGRCSGQ